MHYLDNAATTQPSPIAREAFLSAGWGNPSSLHRLGLGAEKELNAAREAVARSLGCAPAEIYFTSGGTEGNNTALFGAADTLKRRGRRIITTDSEHPSVSEPLKKLAAEGCEVVYLSTSGGELSLEAFENALNNETILVSCMLANNETGAVYPVAELSRVIRAKYPDRRIYLHCDAVQAFLKQPIDVKRLGVDILTVSAHKVHAFKGTGAIYCASGVRLTPGVFGGGQEKALRPGTENLPGICALGAVAASGTASMSERHKMVSHLREYAVQRLAEAVPAVRVNTPPVYSPYILSLTVPSIRSEIMLQYLSSRGVYVSSGSACSSRSGEVSPTLLAYGMSRQEADCTIRVSFSHESTPADVDALAEGLREGCASLARVRLA